ELHSDDGGNRWDGIFPGVCAPQSSADDAGDADTLYSLYGTRDGSKLWVLGRVLGGDGIYRSEDRGRSWVGFSSPAGSGEAGIAGTGVGDQIWSLNRRGVIARGEPGPLLP